MRLSTYQAKILEVLFDRLPIDDPIDTFEFSFTGEFAGIFQVGYGRFREPTSGGVCFNLPKYSSSVFLGLTRDDPKIVARILANLEDYERDHALELRHGEVVITPNQVAPRNQIPFGVILLRTASSPDCMRVPDRLPIDGRAASFLLAVPITADENAFRHRHGHDALMDEFEGRQKDIYF